MFGDISLSQKWDFLQQRFFQKSNSQTWCHWQSGDKVWWFLCVCCRRVKGHSVGNWASSFCICFSRVKLYSVFVLEWIWEETRWGHFLSHLEGFQFQSRSVCNLLWWLVFVWASPGNQSLSPHFVVRSLSKNLSFSWCLFNVMLHRVFLRLGRRWIQMAAKVCEKEVPLVTSLRNDILAHFPKNWTSPTRELVIRLLLEESGDGICVNLYDTVAFKGH